MQFIHNISIKDKQIFCVMLTSGIALLLASVAFAAYEILAFRTEMEQNLSTLTEIIGKISSAALDFDDPKTAKEALSTLEAEPNIEAGCIYDKDGAVFAVYSRADYANFSPPPHPKEGVSFTQNSLQLVQPIVRDGESLGTVYVVTDLSALYSRLARYALIATGVFFTSSLVAYIISIQLQHFISGPILSLVKTAHTVTLDKDYSVRAIKLGTDELGTLIDAFNEMLKQIQERDTALQNSQAELEQRVTERTDELLKSLSLIQATLESTTDGILVTNSNGLVTTYNEKFGEMWRGVSGNAKSVIGKKMDSYKFSHPELLSQPQKTELLARVDEVYRDIEKESFDRVEFKDGRIFERYSIPQRLDDKCVGRVWSFRDITERTRAERDLAYERDLLRTLLDSSPDRIYFKDAQSRFIKVSKSQAEYLKVESVDEMVGKSDFDFFSQSLAKQKFEDEQKIINSGDLLIDKVEIDDHNKVCLTNKMPLRNADGVIIGSFGISKDITAIKEAETRMEELHQQLLEASRQAGMAEVATSVLHNVGNVLNSVNVSSTLAVNQVKKSKVTNLTKVIGLLKEHASDLGTFLTDDPKGKQIPGYLAQLTEHLIGEQNTVLKELDLLHSNIDHIKEIVMTQQSYARVSGVIETLKITDLIEDSLRLNQIALQRHGVGLVRAYEDVPPMDAERHKILQILVNLIRNAKYACDESLRTDKMVSVRVSRDGDRVKIAITDNGVGIPEENMTRIFNHGFTTRREGHGFGLHNSVLAAMEMGGSLSAHSDGPNQGATFILELPFKPREFHA